MIKNRLLLYQVEETLKESERLDNVLRSLEEIHMDYITNAIELDWNFTYFEQDLDKDYIIDDDLLEDDDQYDQYEDDDEEYEEQEQEEEELDIITIQNQGKPLNGKKIQNITNFYNQIIDLESKQKTLFNIQGNKIELKPSKNPLLTAILQNKMT